MIHTTKRYTAKEHIFSIAFAVSIFRPFFSVAVIVSLSLGKAKLLCRCFVLGKATGKARQRKPRCFVFQIPGLQDEAFVVPETINKIGLCAGDAIIRAMGGKVTDKSGAEISYDYDTSSVVDGVFAAFDNLTYSKYFDVFHNYTNDATTTPSPYYTTTPYRYRTTGWGR